MKVTLSRKQELHLIDLGLTALLESLEQRSKPTKQKWTDAQRKKFSNTMKKKWSGRTTKK